MCKYCNKIDDISTIKSKKIDFGLLGEQELYLALSGESGLLYFGIGIYKQCEEVQKINYCPMCGRILESEE